MDVFTPDVNAFRFYEDDGSPSESASTPIAAQDINVNRDAASTDNQLHLRYRVEEVGAGDIAGETTDDYQLQFRMNGGGSWVNVDASSSFVQSDTASQLTDGDPSTNRGTDGISDGAGSFVAGEQEEGDGLITDHQLTANNFTEHVWALNLVSADLVTGNFIEFRVSLNGGNPGMDNSSLPRITILGFTPDADAFRFYEDGTESGSSPAAAEDTNVTGRNVDSDSQIHLRFRLQETEGISGATGDDYNLRFEVNAGGFNSVNDASAECRADNASSLTDNAATTNRAVDGISDGTGSFVAGEQEDTSSPMQIIDHQLTADDFTEHVFALVLQSAGLNDADSLTFGLFLNGTSDNISSIVPGITVAKTAAGAVVQDPIMGPGIIPFER